MVTLSEALGATGIGVADVAMEKLDADKGRTEPLKRWTDYERLGVCVGSLAAQFALRKPILIDLLNGVFYGSLPLVMKTARDYALRTPAGGGAAGAARVVTRPAAGTVAKPSIRITEATPGERAVAKGISY